MPTDYDPDLKTKHPQAVPPANPEYMVTRPNVPPLPLWLYGAAGLLVGMWIFRII